MYSTLECHERFVFLKMISHLEFLLESYGWHQPMEATFLFEKTLTSCSFIRESTCTLHLVDGYGRYWP
jgi:hypothetical protein